jgi:hypothetical protein
VRSGAECAGGSSGKRYFGLCGLVHSPSSQVQQDRRIPSLLTAIQFFVGGICSWVLVRGARIYEFRPVADVRGL